ncbi:hypothetical protein TDB9533_01906 [Thalassocella blandensis]|nr:hypothetical protein TDB9533_01906 [Thalassocella blandensis]
MNKWIALVAAAAVAGAVAFVAFQPKDDAPEVTERRADVSSHELLAYVPADTVYYFGGINSDKVARFMRNYKILGVTPSQTALLLETLSAKSKEGSQIATFLFQLMNGVINHTDGTLAEVTQYFGTDSSGSFALYSDGVVPVVRLPVIDASVFYQRFEDATEASGLPFAEVKLDGVQVKYWTITDAQAQVPVKLAVAEMDNMLVLSFVSGEDDEALVKQRLGIVKPADSLASSGEVRQLKETYGYSEDMIFMVNFFRMAQGFFDPESNSFGKSLMHYLRPEKAEALTTDLTPACKADYLSIAAKVPRLVGGYRALSIADQQMAIDMHSVLEIKNSKVIDELMNVRGHVSQHTQNATDKMFALGLGINVDNAVPSMMALWNEFIAAEFTCDQLVKAQDNARQTNPAMAGIFLGMVQGLKGIGISLYDVDMDLETMQPKNISGMFTAAAENPQTLASMASMIPLLQGVTIPADGSEVLIPLPLLPQHIQLKAAIKGKHLVVYTGDITMADVSTLAKEDIEENGLFGLSIDYRKLGLSVDKMLSLGNFSQPMAMASPDSCEMNLEMSEVLASMKFDFSMLGDIDKTGVVFTGTGTMDEYQWIKPKVAGRYTIATPDIRCQWQDIGVDQMREDGTGHYELNDEANTCVVYTADYTWKQQGIRLIFDIQNGKARETCEAPWVDEEPEQQSCYIFASTEKGFKCKFNPLTAPATLRYSKM